MNVFVSCEVCSTEFETTTYKRSIGSGRYCSRECFFEASKKRIPRKCKVCGKEFTTIPGELKRHPVDYCSRDCMAKGYEKPGAKAARNKRWRENNPEKVEAQRIVNRAIAKGELVRGRCEKCGDSIVDAHHDDYSKPLQVRWLCPWHHYYA